MFCLLGLPSAFPYKTDQSTGVSWTLERGLPRVSWKTWERRKKPSSVYLGCGMAPVSLLPGLYLPHL